MSYKVEKYDAETTDMIADYGTMPIEDVKLITVGYKKTDSIGNCDFYQRKNGKYIYMVWEVQEGAGTMKSTQEEMKKGYKAAAKRKKMMQKWYVVKNGEIMYNGTEKECAKIMMNDMTGELEMYPVEG